MVAFDVASFTDAWIETNFKRMPGMEQRSHLLQMRGLKQPRIYTRTQCTGVASFTDAWIETQTSRTIMWTRWSHLLQMRGLKPEYMLPSSHADGSHLLQMRGLKPCDTGSSSLSSCRIFYRCVD